MILQPSFVCIKKSQTTVDNLTDCALSLRLFEINNSKELKYCFGGMVRTSVPTLREGREFEPWTAKQNLLT